MQEREKEKTRETAVNLQGTADTAVSGLMFANA